MFPTISLYGEDTTHKTFSTVSWMKRSVTYCDVLRRRSLVSLARARVCVTKRLLVISGVKFLTFLCK
jgi:hypothetical protein